MTTARILPRTALLLALFGLSACADQIKLSGPITQQSAAVAIAKLNAATGDEVVLDLDSPGGSVEAGQAIIAAIERLQSRAKVTTFVRSNCESMCVSLWLAGSERKAFSTAHFMLHAAADQGVVNVAVTRELHAYYKERGMNPAWLDTQILKGYLFTTKPLDLSRDELLAALAPTELAAAP